MTENTLESAPWLYWEGTPPATDSPSFDVTLKPTDPAADRIGSVLTRAYRCGGDPNTYTADLEWGPNNAARLSGTCPLGAGNVSYFSATGRNLDGTKNYTYDPLGVDAPTPAPATRPPRGPRVFPQKSQQTSARRGPGSYY